MAEDILEIGRISLRYRILLLILGVLINGIFSFNIEPHIFLTENQILYLMSTMAQVVAGLFGLVLAAYAIIDPKLKAEGDRDDDVKESLDILRKSYFDNIILLSIFCVVTITSCLLTLGFFETVSSKIIPILLNQSSILCVVSIILFLVFGCSLLNPNAISDLNSKALEKVNDGYENVDLEFKPFIEFYNRLETLIFTYASELIDQEIEYTSKYNAKGKYMRMQIFQALDILRMHEIINDDIYAKLDELRRYRNALVHSINGIKVNSVIYDELQKMYGKLQAVYKSKDDEQTREEKIHELYEFGRDISLSEMDKDILEILANHPNVTLREMSLKLSYSRVSLNRKINELIAKGKIIQKGGRYKVLIDKAEFIQQ